LSAVTPAENVRIAIEAVKRFRTGDRPHAGIRRAGTAEARGESDGESQKASPKKAAAAAARPAAEEEILDDIYDAVLDCQDKSTVDLVNRALEQGIDLHAILNEALIAAMDEVGEEFASGHIFVPEMLMSARAMKAGLAVLRPLLTQTGAPPKGRVILATVQGDVHDIGKNLVGMMLEGAGYEVIDLGVNVTPARVLEKANEIEPNVVGLSALLTTSMPSMKKTVELFKEQNSKYPIIVGGAPVTREFANVIGAHGYGENAPKAVEAVHSLVQSQAAAA
jgi:5-methyltetrahydrofolate--homocysteine methyltransferase